MKRIVVAIWMACALWSCGGDKGAMLQRLAYVSQCNRDDTLFTEAWLPTVDSLVSYFDRNGNANERMTAHYLQGRVHHDMGEAPIALECYQKATEVADTTQKDCDYKTLSSIYGQEATLFHKQYLPHRELEAQSNFEKYRWKSQDTLNAIKGYELRVRAYYLMNDTDSILSILTHARKLYLNIGERSHAARTLPTLISICLDRQQYDSARNYMCVFEEQSERFDERGELIGKGIYYYDKGRYALAMGDVDAALTYFDKTLKRGYAEAGYKGKLSVYGKLGIRDSIVKYANLYTSANDSAYLNTNQLLVNATSAMHDFGRIQGLARKKSDEALLYLKWALCGTLLAVAALAISCLLWWNVRKKKETVRYLQERIDKETELLDRLNTEVSLLRAAVVSPSQIIPDSTSPIQSSNPMNELQDLLTDKEKSISVLNAKLKFLKAWQEGSNKGEGWPSISGQEGITITFRKYLKDVRNHPSDMEWQQLFEFMDNALPQFRTIMYQNGTISDEQYKLCCLVRLGFSPSEIHVLMEMSKENVSATRRRLLKKILCMDGKPKAFDHFIKSIR